MAISYTPIGVNDDGTIHHEIRSDSGHVLLTGKHVAGKVTLPDGIEYDITPDFIEVTSPEHAGLVSHHIGLMREQPGCGPDHTHLCTDLCGELKRN